MKMKMKNKLNVFSIHFRDLYDLEFDVNSFVFRKITSTAMMMNYVIKKSTNVQEVIVF